MEFYARAVEAVMRDAKVKRAIVGLAWELR